MDRNEEDEMLDVEFDPSDLENVDEDALLSESALTVISPSHSSTTKVIDNSFESVTSLNTQPTDTNNTAEVVKLVAEIESSQDDVIIPCVKDLKQRVESSPDSEEEYDAEKSPGRDKFKTEKIILRSAIDRSNIPDSLDDVRVPGLVPKPFHNRSSKHTDKRNNSAAFRSPPGSNIRVLLNPHFRGIVQHDNNMKLMWDKHNGASSIGQRHTTSVLTTFPRIRLPNVATIRHPAITTPIILTSGPPPPPPMTGLFGNVKPIADVIPTIRVGPPPDNLIRPAAPAVSFVPNFPNPAKPNIVDVTKPPPLAISTPLQSLIGNKEEWYGATEDFLRKLQSREWPDPSNFSGHRRRSNKRSAANHIRKKYGIGNYPSSSGRRRSSVTSSDSLNRGYSPKNDRRRSFSSTDDEADRVAKKPKLSVDKTVYDDDYLNKLEEQKRMREEFVKRKEKRRQEEINKKQISTKVETYRDDRYTFDSKGSGNVSSINQSQFELTTTSKKNNEPSRIKKTTSKSNEQRFVIRIAKPGAPDIPLHQLKSAADDDQSSSPVKKAANQQRRIVIPPASSKTSATAAAANDARQKISSSNKIVLKLKHNQNQSSSKRVSAKQRLSERGQESNQSKNNQEQPTRKILRLSGKDLKKYNKNASAIFSGGQKLQLWTQKNRNNKA